jgi:RNA polymerase sigma factor (sigma-70 family)
VHHSEEKEYWYTIWEKFRSGDRRAFEIIYEEYLDALYSYGSRITHHRALLEDAIQDLFLDVYAYGRQLRNAGSLEFYLYKTLKRIIIKKLKDDCRFAHPTSFAEHFDLKFPLEERFPEDPDEYTVRLREELKHLDPQKRELLFLKFNSGLTYAEIGELLDCKSDTVKKQVSRLLKLLRQKLGEEFFNFFVMRGIG